jgi:hypothetical protein
VNDWVCRSAANPLLVTLANHDLTGTDAWVCERLPTVVDFSKWVYYVSKTLRYVEELPLPEP